MNAMVRVEKSTLCMKTIPDGVRPRQCFVWNSIGGLMNRYTHLELHSIKCKVFQFILLHHLLCFLKKLDINASKRTFIKSSACGFNVISYEHLFSFCDKAQTKLG
ncbi:MAG TPA: hypothetical protein DEP42_05310 [Ruminococcaceae bacterium]|nr:hypothetical protein [Oscillospiraceae bacterium]